MQSTLKTVIPLILLGLLVSSRCGVSSPVPDDYSDTSEDLDQFDNDVTVYVMQHPSPKYDLESLKKDFDNDPVVSSISSDVQNSLEESDDDDDLKAQAAEAFQQLKPVTSITEPDQTVPNEVQGALSDLLLLIKLLESNIEYMKYKKQQNSESERPFSLDSRMGGYKLATRHEDSKFHQDLHQFVSGVIIMRMMEERVTLVNKYVGDYLSTTKPEVSPTPLFGGSDSVKIVEGALSLKYLEGFLHAANIMINGTIVEENDGEADKASGITIMTRVGPLAPPSLVTDDEHEEEDEFIKGLGLIILILSAIGFFFTLFVIVYTAWKVVQKCYEARPVVLLDGRKKSKYEQI